MSHIKLLVYGLMLYETDSPSAAEVNAFHHASSFACDIVSADNPQCRGKMEVI